MMKSAGAYPHRITLERAVRATGEAGSSTLTWTPVRKFWGLIRDLSGREFELAQRQEAVVTSLCEFRFCPPSSNPSSNCPRVEDRLVFRGRYYGITAVLDPDGLHRDGQLLLSRVE